jgi:hypothetical protein
MPEIGVFVLTWSGPGAGAGPAGFPIPETGVFVLSWSGPAGAWVGASAVCEAMFGAGLGRGSSVGPWAIPE